MGVNVDYIAMYGIKKDYNFIKSYKSKNDPKYIEDTQDGTINNYKNIIFEDYLPDNFIILRDEMSGAYSAIGLLLHHPVEYIDEIRDVEIGEAEREKYMAEAIRELSSLGITFNSSRDVKFHSFVHFS